METDNGRDAGLRGRRARRVAALRGDVDDLLAALDADIVDRDVVSHARPVEREHNRPPDKSGRDNEGEMQGLHE